MAQLTGGLGSDRSRSSGGDDAAGMLFLAAGFLLGSTVTVVATTLYLRRSHSDNIHGGQTRPVAAKGNNGVYTATAPSPQHPSPQPAVPTSLPREIRDEQLSRTVLYFGEGGMNSLSDASVVVVGLGGVGSHAAVMLARAGVGRLRLIDFDQVTLSSLNRHACATLADVGTSKAECLERHIARICGSDECRVDARVAMYTEEDEEELLGTADGGGHDFIVDAIDDVTTKVQLLAYCVRTKTRVVSCTGAGGKSDPTRIHVGDLPGACHDPLATKIRLFLKRKKVPVDSDLISIVYSSEKTVAPLATLTDEQKEASSPGEFGAVDNMRVRVLPVLGTMPAIMGQACAAFALCEIGGKPFSPLSGERMGKNVRHRLFQHLKNREKAIRIRTETQAQQVNADGAIPTKTNNEKNKAGKGGVNGTGENDTAGRMIGDVWVGPVQVDCDDVEYLAAEVWRFRCAATGERMGVTLELARWDLGRPSTCNNLVLMSTKAIRSFDSGGRDWLGKDVRRRIEGRLAWCKMDARA